MFLDPLLQGLANLTAQWEVPLNAAIVIVALGLALGLAVVRMERVRPLLTISIVLSLLLWVATEGAGQVLSGTATDFNSGLPLAILALTAFPMLQQTAGNGKDRPGETRDVRVSEDRPIDRAPHLST
jgi:hypothetical protein